MLSIFLSKDEVEELLGLLRRRSILHNILSVEWDNDFGERELWAAEEKHFQLLLDTLQVTFPHLGPL